MGDRVNGGQCFTSQGDFHHVSWSIEARERGQCGLALAEGDEAGWVWHCHRRW
jgi:hypothetical protein